MYHKLLMMLGMLVFGCGVDVRAAEPSKPLSGINMEDFQQKSKEGLRWENNPFVQPVEETSIHDLNLMAIVFREGDAAALINGQVVREGETIGFSEVVHITKKTVTLRNENGVYRLALKGGGK